MLIYCIEAPASLPPLAPPVAIWVFSGTTIHQKITARDRQSAHLQRTQAL
jgi:hypothetical protein